MDKYIVTMLFLFGLSARAQLIDVQDLNKSLSLINADWYATENKMTHLSEDQAKQRLGVPLDSETEGEFLPVDENEVQLEMSLPEQIDWRNKDGKNWISPIKDQANCGSCVAFASVGTFESQLKIDTIMPNLGVNLSPQHLFSCGGGSCTFGWLPDSAARFLKNHGVPDESCMPYSSGFTGHDTLCRATCTDSSRRVFRLQDYSRPTYGIKNLKAIKTALLKGPLVTLMKVYSDFFAYGSGTYRHVKGSLSGGHAVSIVGYDDVKKAFIVRNSWGEDWGEKGFVNIAYDDDSGVGSFTWQFQVSPLGGAVSINSPEEYSFFSQEMPLEIQSNFSRARTLKTDFFSADGKLVRSEMCSAPQCKFKMDLMPFADGKYYARTSANTEDEKELGHSTLRQFYVVNDAPQIEINFKGINKTDLRGPIKGKAEIQVQMKSNSVPLSGLVYHRMGPDGKEKTRTLQFPPNIVNLEWKTDALPNGKYQIWFEGKLKSNKMDLKYLSPRKTLTVKN